VANAFPVNVSDSFWASIETDDSVCGWNNYSPESNCRFLVDLRKAFKSRLNVQVDFLFDDDSWLDSMKQRLACPEISDSRLWWVPK